MFSCFRLFSHYVRSSHTVPAPSTLPPLVSFTLAMVRHSCIHTQSTRVGGDMLPGGLQTISTQEEETSFVICLPPVQLTVSLNTFMHNNDHLAGFPTSASTVYGHVLGFNVRVGRMLQPCSSLFGHGGLGHGLWFMHPHLIRRSGCRGSTLATIF